MLRKIIKIDREKCNGCGLCVSACQEGALGIINGKAQLLREDYCDGLGNCLPSCPKNAITFEEREAEMFNETEVKKHMENIKPKTLACGCPGTHSKSIVRENTTPHKEENIINNYSQLNQWPVQIKLAPINAPYFNNANLLIAADCSAYAYGNFHNEFIKNRITLIGCPKLDEGDYSEKLTEILKNNDIKSITVTRMEVPCCGGIERAVKTALMNCGKLIQWRVVTISTSGEIIE